MSIKRLSFYLLLAFLLALMTGISIGQSIIVGRNVNMVSGTILPGGDPWLQRQNEPSIAASTRNPLHLLAGANDYRTVDMATSEGELPGIPEGAAAGDAWLGVYKSYNGGQSWTSTLLPGYPQDYGSNSPLSGFQAAADPTVRAGTNGLFYYSGIAFDRIEHGRSVIFIARYIDNNTTQIGDPDPIKHLDITILDEGTPGQFADKPWIAVDKPRYGSDTVPIYAPDAPVQNVARHNVYILYSVFLGNAASGNPHSKILFVRSTDSGNTWEKPIKLSESEHLNQGTTIAISPKDGTIYVAWRRFEALRDPHAIVVCKSIDYGNGFTKPKVIAEIDSFDQFTDSDRFRTSAFPALAVDDNGIVYVAWSDRGWSDEGDARIVISSSKDGIKWSKPDAIDNHTGRGHQIMPSLSFAAGKLLMTWFDTRKSEGGYDYNISDPGPTGSLHTMDVWVAQANPSNSSPNIPKNPTFTDSTQVSRYLYWAKINDAGQILGVDGQPIAIDDPNDPNFVPPDIYQAQFNPANYPLFKGGTVPFHGDYIDITPAPMFLFDEDNGTWRFNTGEWQFDPFIFHVTWTDNRDVIPPKEGLNWMDYSPPGSPGCLGGLNTGMRNQNIYTAPITQGFMVGSPANTKPLSGYKRSFLVFVKNLTDYDKYFRLTILPPTGMQASFWEEWPLDPVEEPCPFKDCKEKEVWAYVYPHSTITLTVFVEPYSNPYATFRVKVEETDVDSNSTGLENYIVLNPDPVNTQIIPVAEEYHTPTIISGDPEIVELFDPTMLSHDVVYVPYLDELLNFANPDILAPSIRSPSIRSANIVNPSIRSPSIRSIPEGTVTDLQWRVTNDGDNTSAYSFEAIGEIPEVPYQLLIYRVHSIHLPLQMICAS